MKRLAALALLTLTSCFAASVTPPETFFGFPLGTDRKLADWAQLTSYYQKLAAESNRVRYAELGKTTEGRPFVLVTISSPENLAHLAEYQEIQRKLADPRTAPPQEAEKLFARGKNILTITVNIHSTEIASSQTAAEFTYQLATGNTPEIKKILNETIILLVPSLNPDGQQLVVDWYKKYLGTPYEGNPPVVLYQKYVGHDNNRDWYTFTQAETRLTVAKVLNAWHPQIVYDVHQMQSTGPRIYLPPWVDPVDPNIDPILVQSMNALGTDTALSLSAAGKTGVLVNGVYDLWSPARHYMLYHAGLRMLTESASANIATPAEIPFSDLGKGRNFDAKESAWNFPEPWKGGTWRLGDIVAYQLVAFHSIARNAAENRERYLRQFYEVGERAVHRTSGPYAFVVPAGQKNPDSTARLINTLRFGEVEVAQAAEDFSADGQRYSKGSYLILLSQPYGSWAKTLLERQDYPNLIEYAGGPPKRPYDVTTQCLPLLFGVEVATVKDQFNVRSSPVDQAALPAGRFESNVGAGASAAGYTIAGKTNADFAALFALLKDRVSVYRLTSGGFAPGTIYIPNQADASSKLSAIAAHFSTSIVPVREKPAGHALAVTLPRVGLYKSWIPSLDEGWTRWLFEQNGIPYTSIYDFDIKKGGLTDRFDVIIVPDNAPRAILRGQGGFEGETPAHAPKTPPEFAGGLGASGFENLLSFAKAGGTIVAINRASLAFVEGIRGVPANALKGLRNNDFYGPGTLLQVTVDPANPIAFGSDPVVPIFFENGPAFQVSTDDAAVAKYTADKVLLSGWLLGGDHLKGTSALTEVPLEKGRLILFGFAPNYRAQSEATYKFLFNSLLYASSKAQTF